MASLKKTLFNVLMFVLIFCLAGSTAAYAGAWTKKKGELYGETLFTYYTTHHNFDKHGRRSAMSNHGRFSKEEFNEYVEWGLCDRLTLLGNFFYDLDHYHDRNTSEFNNGFANNELGARYRWLNRAVVGSVQQIISIPSRFKESSTLPITNGQIDLETRILFGSNLDKIKSYINVENGIRFRLDGPADEYRIQALIGCKAFHPMEFIFQYDGIVGLHNSRTTTAGNNVTINPEFDLHRLAGTALWHINDHFALKVQPYVHAAGANTGQGWGIVSGIVLDF